MDGINIAWVERGARKTIDNRIRENVGLSVRAIIYPFTSTDISGATMDLHSCKREIKLHGSRLGN